LFVTDAYILFLIHLLAFLAASKIGLKGLVVFLFREAVSFVSEDDVIRREPLDMFVFEWFDFSRQKRFFSESSR